MRENRTYGSEGGEAKSLPYPYRFCSLQTYCFASAIENSPLRMRAGRPSANFATASSP